MTYNLHVSLLTHAIHLRSNQTVYRERARTKFSSKLPKHNFPLIWNQIDNKSNT